eukprot:EG_transcript_24069
MSVSPVLAPLSRQHAPHHGVVSSAHKGRPPYSRLLEPVRGTGPLPGATPRAVFERHTPRRLPSSPSPSPSPARNRQRCAPAARASPYATASLPVPRLCATMEAEETLLASPTQRKVLALLTSFFPRSTPVRLRPPSPWT